MKAVEELLYILCSIGLGYTFIGIYKVLVGLNNGGKISWSYLAIIFLIPAVILQHTLQISYSIICLQECDNAQPYFVLFFLSISWMLIFAIIATVFPPYRDIKYDFSNTKWRLYTKNFRRVLYFFSFFYVLNIPFLQFFLNMQESWFLTGLRVMMMFVFLRAIILSYKIVKNEVHVYFRIPWILKSEERNFLGIEKTTKRQYIRKIDCQNTNSIAKFTRNRKFMAVDRQTVFMISFLFMIISAIRIINGIPDCLPCQ